MAHPQRSSHNPDRLPQVSKVDVGVKGEQKKLPGGLGRGLPRTDIGQRIGVFSLGRTLALESYRGIGGAQEKEMTGVWGCSW